MPIPERFVEMLKKQAFPNSTLSLPSCGITDQEVIALIDLMIDNHPRITSINLTNNAISRNGATRLLEVTWLKELNLSNNRLGFDDKANASMFIEAYKRNTCMQAFNLSANYFTQGDIAEILRASQNKTCNITIENNKNLSEKPSLLTESISPKLTLANSTRIVGHPGLSSFSDEDVVRIKPIISSK